LSGAIAAYTAALQESPDWQNTVTIRRALAELAVAQKDYRAAVAQYDLLRGEVTTGAWAAEMQWLAGSALAQGGERTEAVRRWQAAVDADLTSGFAHQAVVALLDAGTAVDEYQRGLVNFYQGNYSLALAAFDRLRGADPTGRRGGAWYYAGLSYLRLGQPGLALAELDSFIRVYQDSPLWAKAWLAKGEAQAAAGDVSAGLATYRKLAELLPAAAEAPQALWRAAALEAEKSGPTQAAESYLALGRRYPAADEAPRAYQAAGLAYFRGGDYGRASAVWAEMAGVEGETGAVTSGTPVPPAQLPAWTRPMACYWLGRAQAAAGETEAAQRAWQAAWEAGPETFYGLRAASRLSAGRGEPLRSATEAEAGPAPAQEATILAEWLRTWAGAGSLTLPAALRADPDWRRGEMLLSLDWWTVGLGYWERAQRRYAADPWALTAMALAFRDAGANRLSMLCAEQLVARWGHPLAEAPLALQRLVYPFPFADLIRAEAAKRDLDPRLIAAVIRQESRFEWTATSSVGAQGLMQLMPGTADWVAMKLAWPGFEPRQAYWPYVNVTFGAYYLHFALDEFDGSLATALAGYNGGPGNAARWRQEAGGDDDLMVALIPIGETRLYAQTVWVQYEVYKRLYPEIGK
jgi:soluble lytic murein transglycosylase